MSEETPERISVTLKAGKEFSDPWIVPKGGSVAEVNEILDELQNTDTLQKVAIVADAFHKIYIAVRNGGQAPAQAPQNLQQSIPQQAPFPPEWAQQQVPTQPEQQAQPQFAAKFCTVCGQPLQRKAGEKNGRSWAGWFCQTKGHPVVWND